MNEHVHPQFHHALKFREDICIGCSHCMNHCPTEAIRVSRGKAQLLPNHCVDCGECYRVCPVGAIIVEQDDFDNIYQYPVRVALVPAVFTGQFPESTNPSEIHAAVLNLGFTHVFEVEEGVDFLLKQYHQILADTPATRPLISPFCPAIVRLIQVKFPTLVNHIIRLKAPLDITALRVRNTLESEGNSPAHIGIFYVTPCAAKIVAVKSPVGEDHSGIDGVINMNFLYNKVFRVLRQRTKPTLTAKVDPLPGKSVCWSLTNGESVNFPAYRSLAIDEINNVIEFLEKLENEEIGGIDFLELRACDESCAGGILCPGNRFLTADKLRKRESHLVISCIDAKRRNEEYDAEGQFLLNNMVTKTIPPRSILKLDNDVSAAMIKMKRIYELTRLLPQVDCGICGSPSCKSLAEDIVQRESTIRQCIFIQKVMEQNDTLDQQEAVQIMRGIWGDNKLDKNILKGEINE